MDECAVCLETKPLESHCDRCAIKTCQSCHEKLLGLCPICSRQIISTPFQCYVCNQFFSIFEIEDVNAPLFYICKECAHETDSDSDYTPSESESE